MNLPDEYIYWLDSIDAGAEYNFKNIIINYYSKPDLRDKQLLASKFFREQVFTSDNKELKAEELASDNTYLFTKDRTDKCITIGASNGNYIFVDPFDNYSIWILILSNKCVFKERGNIHDIVKYSMLHNA